MRINDRMCRRRALLSVEGLSVRLKTREDIDCIAGTGMNLQVGSNTKEIS